VFDSEAAKLRSENIALRDQLHRSLKELKLFQTKYPSPFSSQLETDRDEAPPQLSTSPEITSALFDAYDTRKQSGCLFALSACVDDILLISGIFELEDTIKLLNGKLATFRENVG